MGFLLSGEGGEWPGVKTFSTRHRHEIGFLRRGKGGSRNARRHRKVKRGDGIPSLTFLGRGGGNGKADGKKRIKREERKGPRGNFYSFIGSEEKAQQQRGGGTSRISVGRGPGEKGARALQS